MGRHPYLWIERLHIVKVAILFKYIYKFNTVAIKVSSWPFVFFSFFAEVDKLIVKFIQKCKETKIAKRILDKKNSVRRLIFFCFKTHYKVTII